MAERREIDAKAGEWQVLWGFGEGVVAVEKGNMRLREEIGARWRED